jgi:thiol-disulfide isomerase/thioredoxin
LDVKGKSYTLKDLSDNHPYIIIDCWATWCIPCIKQMTYLADFEKKYNKSILFLHLSIDSDYKRWQKYLSTSKKGNKMDLLIDQFEVSVFYKYFNLISIPRFIFLKTNGSELTSIDMPIPEQKQHFEKFILENIPDIKSK